MKLWHRIVLAAPTCTLWVVDFNAGVLRFRFWRTLAISREDIVRLEKAA